MKNTRKAFTLAELLVIIAIIVILALMLMSALTGGGPAPVNKAKLEMSALCTAIEAYHSVYGRYPVSPAALEQAARDANDPASPISNNGDFTYGGVLPAPHGKTIAVGTLVNGRPLPNSEVISILMDYTNFPNHPGQSTVNTNHGLNIQNTLFLNTAKSSATNSPGVGPDLVYRDPWGHPYIITMDLNGDGQCNDSFYGLQQVSQHNGAIGFYGLSNNVDAGGNGPHFQFHSPVMVWSVGPKIGSPQGVDTNSPANVGANKNHVLSWQ
jgi:type II secretory pathway pseudopilin PulG